MEYGTYNFIKCLKGSVAPGARISNIKSGKKRREHRSSKNEKKRKKEERLSITKKKERGYSKILREVDSRMAGNEYSWEHCPDTTKKAML